MKCLNRNLLVILIVAGLLLSTTASAAPVNSFAESEQRLETDSVTSPGYSVSEDRSQNNSSRSDTPDNAGPGDAVTGDDKKRTLSYGEQIRNNSVLSSDSDGWKPAQPSSVTSLDEPVDPEKADRVVVRHPNGSVTTYEPAHRKSNAEDQRRKTPPNVGLLADRNDLSQSTRNEVEPESVIGNDDRQRITNTAPYPWRTIVELRIVAADGTTLGCTGALIDPNHVLTAGH